ncbi:S8 family serine peptidase [Primorskyibacter sp. 2E233]|uniref:S8 family serine peptidase n=1 Tax=Primorskyibacter sp. 2E233 TaxID=3413431 RepID=UPI003BF276AF
MDRNEVVKDNATHESLGLGYLWHLEAIRLHGQVQLERGAITQGCELWTQPKDQVDTMGGVTRPPNDTKVAIIDNGAAYEHPNLSSDRMLVRADFGGGLLGADYASDGSSGAKTAEFDIEEAAKQLQKKASEERARNEQDPGADSVQPLNLAPLLHPEINPRAPIFFPPILPGPEEYKNLENPSFRFAAHGTACAGLVGANAATSDTNPHTIAYSGVDPFAKIIPINTAYSHEYWTLIVALLFASSQDADVILIPRAIEDMADPQHCDDKEHHNAARNPRYSRFISADERWQQKLLFEETLEAVSEVIPVVVAAGNNGPGSLEYPARLTTDPEKSKRFKNLIVVGAMTAYGTVASYSSGRPNKDSRFSDDVTIYAPSDDREEISSQFGRFDDLSWSGRKLPRKYYSDQCDYSDKEFCPYKILAIDIPGPYGYSVTPNDVGDLKEPGSVIEKGDECYTQNQPVSLYTLFGGTSAAASIVAGTISFMKRVEPTCSLSVARVKEILLETAQKAPDMRHDLPEKPEPGPFLNACAAIEAASREP